MQRNTILFTNLNGHSLLTFIFNDPLKTPFYEAFYMPI